MAQSEAKSHGNFEAEILPSALTGISKCAASDLAFVKSFVLCLLRLVCLSRRLPCGIFSKIWSFDMTSAQEVNHLEREHEALLSVDPAHHSTIREPSPLPQLPQEADLKELSTEDVNATCSDCHHSECWSTIWLRKRTLISFMVLFAAIIASLLMLRAADLSRNGFRQTLGSNHYDWTYGPTAILTFVLAPWRQVDFHCKILQPWHELRKGPRPADRTLLLDHVGTS